MSIAWKQFQFYQSIPIKDPFLGTDQPLYSDSNLSALTITSNNNNNNNNVTSNNSFIIIMATSNHTNITIIDLQKLTILSKFNLMDQNEQNYIVSHIRVINNNTLSSSSSTDNNIQWVMFILTSRSTSPNQPTIIRFYQLNKLLNYNNNNNQTPPPFHSECIISSQKDNSPISSFDITPDLSIIALGYLNGDIIIIRGDIAHDKGSRQRKIFSGQSILSINLIINPSTKNKWIILASTLTQILLFSTMGDNKGKPNVLLGDNLSLNLNSMAWDPQNLKFWTVDNVGSNLISYKLNHEREIIKLPPFLHTNNTQSDISIKINMLSLLDSNHILLVVEEYPRINKDNYKKIHRFIILDIHNHIVAFNSLVQDPILEYLGGLNKVNNISQDFYLLSTNGVLYQITRKSFAQIVDVILSKYDFPLAIEFVQNSIDNNNNNNVNSNELYRIHEKYAKYLFDQGQYLESIQEYTQCLPIININETLTKFSSLENLPNNSNKNDINYILSVFLWSLLERNKATADHITLLLIILIKLNNVELLNNFIQHFTRSGEYVKDITQNDISNEEFFYSNKDLFDLDLVIELLRECNLLVEAYEMAKKFSKDPILIVSILLDDLKEPQSALNFIKTLPIDDTLRIMCQFSRQLLSFLPNDTNLLLIEIFTGNYKPKNNKNDETVSLTRRESDLKKIFYSYKTFLSYMNSGNTYTLPEIKSDNQFDKTTDGALSDRKVSDATYHPPKPSLIFSSFIDKPFQFVVFLEACLETYEQYEGFKQDLQEILVTLYDLYYYLSKTDEDTRRDDWRRKAENILKKSDVLKKQNDPDLNNEVDNSLMLLISHMNGVHINNNENEKNPILETFDTMILIEKPSECWTYFLSHVDKEPQLFPVALKYFTSNDEIFRTIGGEPILKEKLIDPILKDNIISLTEIIEILSNTDTVKFKVIQDLLINYFEKQEIEIENNTKLIDSYEKELNERKARLQELMNTDKPIEIVIKDKKCYMCELPLELPLLYFKCGHIYHKRCLNEEDNSMRDEMSYKCPKCILELESSNKILDDQKDIAQDKELLETILNTSEGQKDRFKIISEFIGRGGLEYSRIEL